MNQPTPASRPVAIACGGTGGHLFPGLAVAEKLAQFGCEVTLLVSPKEIDQQCVKSATNVRVETLPAVCLKRGGELAFLRGSCESYRASRRLFKSQPPRAVLAMGGFTSAPPILAARVAGAQTFLHESNVIPGRANRWLAWVVDQAFVGFPSAAGQLKRCRVTVSGTPVRAGFKPRDAAIDRLSLGLDPDLPLVLVMGGSQGASGVNQMVARSLPVFARLAPEMQWLHLSGPNDASELQRTYDQLGLRAMVRPFFDRMDLALGAASMAISRAGAASLAELAAMRLPALLVPYPAAADDHQWHNARTYELSGAAHIMEQRDATPEILAAAVLELVENQALRETMQAALARWERPHAAAQIAVNILDAISLAESREPAYPAFGPLPAARIQRTVPGAAVAAPFLSPPIVRGSRQTEPATL